MSLEFSIEWEDAPGVALDTLRATWARLEIKAQGQVATRFWSERTKSIRNGVYGSVWPLAHWIVRNWWNLLYEAFPDPAVLQGGRQAPSFRDWLSRHNLLFGRDGMPYPDLSLYREDESLGICWQPDSAGVTTPGRFLDAGMVRIPVTEAEGALAHVVECVLARLDGVTAQEVLDLRADWAAIRRSWKTERSLCERLGALGVDPYEEGAVEGIEELLEEVQLDEMPLRDLLAATSPSDLRVDLAAASSLLQSLEQGSAQRVDPPREFKEAEVSGRPYATGYERAALLRQEAGLTTGAPIVDFSQFADDVVGQLRTSWVEPKSKRIEGMVYVNGCRALAATDRSSSGRRFLIARALHHMVFCTSAESPRRLITSARDWQQACSRAFAAELLAPAVALEARSPGWDDVEDLAEEFQVSPMVIVHQLKNHRIA